MRRHFLLSHMAEAAMVALTLAAATSCASSQAGGTAPSASQAPPVASASATSSSPAATTVPAADCDTGAWQTAPVTVTHHVAVPPVPVITAVRAARHPECGYDRIVLDIKGPVPGYNIRYASKVIADPSGNTITVPGRRYLLVTLRQAQAHTGAGAATISRHVQVLSSPMLASWALAGDFEGVVTLAVGLHDTTSIRVGELPGRLYIDVKN
jgi:hypothetical protein